MVSGAIIYPNINVIIFPNMLIKQIITAFEIQYFFSSSF